MITFGEVKQKVNETYGEKTPGFRYGIIVFYSLFTEAIVAFTQQLVALESLNGITRKDKQELINWIQRDVQKPMLLGVGFDEGEVDEDILEAKILMSGHEITAQ